MKTDSPAEAEKEIIKKTVLIALVPLLSSLIMGEFAAFLGIVFGLSISILLFHLKRINIENSLQMSSADANTYIRNRYFVNYLIYFIVLAISYQKESINFFAVVVGILLLKFTIVGLAFIDNLKKSWQEKKDNIK